MKGPEAALVSWPMGPVLGCHSAGGTQLGGYQIVVIPHAYTWATTFMLHLHCVTLVEHLTSEALHPKDRSFLAQLPGRKHHGHKESWSFGGQKYPGLNSSSASRNFFL